MAYICAICMITRAPLLWASPEDKRILEAIVAPVVSQSKMEQLSTLSILLCCDCNILLQNMLKLQKTALMGVEHLLSLHAQLEDTTKKPRKVAPKKRVPQKGPASAAASSTLKKRKRKKRGKRK